MTAQSWEPRVSRLEGAIEQIGDRLADLHGDMTALRTEMHDNINGLRTEFRWMLATMIALTTALGAFLHFAH